MDLENSKTYNLHMLLLNLADKMDLQRGEKRLHFKSQHLLRMEKYKKLIKKHINLKQQLQNRMPFTNYKGEINNLQIVNATDLNVVMLVYNSRKYSDNYAKTLHLRVH